MGRCIRYAGIRLLLLIHIIISSFFFLSNFQTLKFLVILFSGTVRPRRLKHGTQVDGGQMYCLYRNQAAAAYSSPYFFIFFRSSFQTLKHMYRGWMYGVYQNQVAAAYLTLYFFFLQYSNIKIFVTLFSRTVRPKRLKLGAHMDNG